MNGMAGGQFTWPKYLPENLPEKTSHQKVTIKKSNWIFGKILGKIFWPCELTSSFLKVPLACLGSMAAALQTNSLGTLRKHLTKPSEQVAAPPDLSPLTGKSLKFIDFLVVLQLIHRQTRTKIS